MFISHDGFYSLTHSWNCHIQVSFILLLLFFSSSFCSSGSSFSNSISYFSDNICLFLCFGRYSFILEYFGFVKWMWLQLGKIIKLFIFIFYVLFKLSDCVTSLIGCSPYPCLSKPQGSLHSKFIGLSIFGVCQKWWGSRAYSCTSRQSLHKPGSIYGLDT